MTAYERFAREHDIPIDKVRKLVKLASQRGNAATYGCNGEPHKLSKDQWDKNENARNWDKEVESFDAKIMELMKPFGFTAVVATGLGPTLMKGEKYIDIPYHG